MAEKDKTEGRCPACRTPYDKEKAVGTTATCESLVAELNNDRKKSQKVKPKPSEGKKDLTGVRVIQRNLVYVMSLPLDLADEDLFQSREYFGQYGKVVKVALARTQTGEIQQFPNNSCSVYITYSKEEEAIRCIRSVHLFVFDGRSLKACFGTMKYCHAWIRNMPCNNVECLYLHEIGSQEDSFTKDETISVHMRRIIEEITGAVPNSPRGSGSMLPPPVDDYVGNVSIARQIPKCVLNNAQSVVKTSPPNSSNGRSVSLPAGALWGMHASSKSSVPNIPCSGEPFRVKAVTVPSAVATNSVQVSASHSDVSVKPALEDIHTSYGNGLKSQELLDSKTEFPELSLVNRTQTSNGKALVSASHSDLLKKPGIEDSRISYGNALKPKDLLDSQTDFPELSSVNRTQTNDKPLVPANVDNTRAISVPSDCTNFPEPTSQSCRSMLSNGDENINGGVQSVCSDAVSVDSDSVVDGYGGLTRSDSSHVDHVSLKSSHTVVSLDSSLQHCVNKTREVQQLQKTGITKANDVVSREEVNVGTALMSPLVTNRHLQAEDDISSFIRERLKDPEVFSCQPIAANKASFLRTMQPSSSQYMAEHDEARSMFGSSLADSRGSNIASISHGYNEMPQSEPGRLNGSRNHSMLLPDIGNGNCGVDSQGSSRNEIDDRIASILSLDLDEYLTSPHNMSKQLGAGDVEARSHNVASYCEVKNNQSRFSFARQDESNDQAFRSSNIFNQRPHGSDFYQNSSERQSRDLNTLGMYNGFSSSYLKGMDHVPQTSTLPSSYKPPSVARSPVTAPPGFSVTSRPPPPGFSSNGREQQTLNGFSGNHRYSESPVYNTTPYHQSLPIENNGGVRDVEFLDPAILAVGQGIENPSLDYRSNFQGNTNMFSNETKLQQHHLGMQSPLSSHQNCRLTDSLGMASRFMDQSRNVALPNSHWDGLSNEIQSQNRFQNERFIGSTNRMSGYNGTFRI
ncbi:RNA binding (RRM/RBD/RNP motifs) family protein [Raphanus sativus]|nr:RNA binding (RRM/RBD/RNP motifs) family protein [Raphanus sativus]